MTHPTFVPQPSFPLPRRTRLSRHTVICEHRVKDKTILVTGATSPTGLQILHSLYIRGAQVRAFIRPQTYLRLRSRIHAISEVCPNAQYAVGDLRDPTTLPRAVADCDGIICASGTRNFEGTDSNRPEIVDYRGVQRLVEAFWDVRLEQDLTMMLLDDVEGDANLQLHDRVIPVVEASNDVSEVPSFVLVSSLGVTRPERFPQLQQMGNLLTWKMCGEDALRKSGLPFTIVRPGGFVDAPAGEMGVIVDQGDRLSGRVSRADVAEICVEALFCRQATNVTFECVSGFGGGGKVTQDVFNGLIPDKL